MKPLWNPLVSIGRRLDERIAKSAGEISVNELSKAVELTDNEERSVEEKEILERIVKFCTCSERTFARENKTSMSLSFSRIEVRSISASAYFPNFIFKPQYIDN